MRQYDPTAASDHGAAAGRRILSPVRAAVSLGMGVVAGLVPALLGAPSLSPLTGWIAAASLALAWVWKICWPQDAHGTKRLAEAETRSHSIDLAVLIASTTSVGGVLLALSQSDDSQNNGLRVALTVLSVISSLVTWALVNTVFALKYARHYYLNDGGIDFKQKQPPAYSDFAYLAFTLGMSYAVSDTELATTPIRKTSLGHALLSYGFGTIIIAVAINLITNLSQH
ncbi:MAG TPA: DUF1345 domain-containing protein [Propionibacteriaceae bacterium]|nr:DUF1345 domain-containing protein [Propionibacteriaceae bacterium]